MWRPKHGRITDLVVAGRSEIFILDLSSGSEKAEKVWTWSASDATDIPADIKKRLTGLGEAKPLDGGRLIAVTASGGGVVFLERESKKAVFYGIAGNAHSADLVPNNIVAIAASHVPQEQVEARGEGDLLYLYSLDQPGKVVGRFDLPSAHGVAWDPDRELLWALSGSDLRAYSLIDWGTASPSLKLETTNKLPDGGGKELYPIPGTGTLTVSTSKSVWIFDCERRNFEPHSQLASESRVKSVSLNPETGQVVYVQAETGKSRAAHLKFLLPRDTLHLPGSDMYKARWNLSTQW